MSDILHVTLTNRVAKFQRPYPYDEVIKLFRYRPPGYYYMPAYRHGGWDGWKKLLLRDSVSAGLFRYRLPALRKIGNLKVHKTIIRPEFRKDGKGSDRGYQTECLDALIKKSDCGGIVLSATGTGKTRIAGMYFSRLRGYGCFIVDELTLLDQTQEELSKFLREKVGMIGDMKFRPKRITVATIQTLYLHKDDPEYAGWVRSLDAVFIDELHLALNRSNLETVRKIPAKAVFGLTATLEMQKPYVAVRATALCGPVIYKYPLQEGVEEGHLVKGIVVGLDLVRKGKPGYGYQEEYTSRIVRSRARNDAIEELVREAVDRGYYVIVLVERVDHIHRLAYRLEDLNVRTVFGEKTTRQRRTTQKKFERGKIEVIIANKVFKKGINIKRVDAIIDAASMKSKNDARQKYGRGVRVLRGKYGLIYIDVGERTPEGIARSSPYWNRFQSAATSRRRALKADGTKVVVVEWEDDAAEVFDQAEEALRKIVKHK